MTDGCDIQEPLENNPFKARNIFLSNEATLSSNGTVSTQNCRWCNDTNSSFAIKSWNKYALKIVMCEIWKKKFFQSSFNVDLYLQFLENVISHFLDSIFLLERQQVTFQRDGVVCHSCLNVRQLTEKYRVANSPLTFEMTIKN